MNADALQAAALRDLYCDVTAADSVPGNAWVDVTAGRDLTGTSIHTAGNLSATAGGNLAVPLVAGGDVTALAAGSIQYPIHADGNVWMAAYGNIGGTVAVTAGQDITLAWSRGHMGGSFSAGRDITRVMCYDTIGASFAATGSVGDVEAWYGLSGTITAGTSVAWVQSGRRILATITAPSVGVVQANSPGVFGPYPDDPNVSLAALSAGMAEGQRGIAQYYAEATLAKSAQARAIVAAAASKDEARALTLDEFAASRTEATASLATTGLALADSVAWAQGSANRALVGFAADIHDVQKSVEGALAAASAGNAFTLRKLQADTDTAKQQTQSLADADTLSMQMLLNGKAHDQQAEMIRLYGEQQRRQKMIEYGWCRSNINKHIGRLKTVFRWSTEQELVSGSIHHALQAVTGLKRGRSAVCDPAESGQFSRWRTVRRGLPAKRNASALQSNNLSRLNTQPARTPVNASSAPLPTPSHDSGPM